MTHLTDQELAGRVREGDVSAYEPLVRRYQGLVFAVAFHQLGNAEDARDVAQDVFVRAFSRLGQVRDPARMGPWLRQIAVNECRAFLAKRKPFGPLREEPSAPDPLAGADDRLLLSSALAAIDEKSRLTVVLFYLHAYSLKEIGAFLDEPVTTIKSRLRNARGKLRKEMEERLERNLNEEALPEGFAAKVTRIIETVEAGDQRAVRELLLDDPRLVSVHTEKASFTPLHIAAAGGNVPMVELLLAHGADPNALDAGDNASPLHHAAERGWLETVKLLVDAGADVNWNQDVHERGPLGWAVVFQPVQTEVAEYLMAAGAKLDLFSAIALGRVDAVRSIVEADPSTLRQRTSECDGRLSAIEFAGSKRQLEIAHFLADLGAEVGLPEAAALGMADQIRTALAANPNPDEVERALKVAVQSGQTSTARRLLEHGADPNLTLQSTSILFDAIGAEDAAMARLLLEFGADLEFKDRQWNSTPLGWQVFFGNPSAARLALDLGAKVTPNLPDLARAGERGDLRRWSSGAPGGYRRVLELLTERAGET